MDWVYVIAGMAWGQAQQAWHVVSVLAVLAIALAVYIGFRIGRA